MTDENLLYDINGHPVGIDIGTCIVGFGCDPRRAVPGNNGATAMDEQTYAEWMDGAGGYREWYDAHYGTAAKAGVAKPQTGSNGPPPPKPPVKQ